MDPSVKYPYGILAKMVHYPIADHWKRGRYNRYLAYALVATLPFWMWMDKQVNSPGNVNMWKEIRASRIHDPFERPTEHGRH